LAPLTAVIGSGSWPTPQAADGQGGRNETEALNRAEASQEPIRTLRRPSGAKASVSLRTAVEASERGLWPTPTSSDAHKGYASPPGETNNRGRETLSVNTWPTPSVKGNYNRKGLSEKSGDGLATAVAKAESFKTPTSAPFSHGGSKGELHKQVAPSGGPLNPQWVAWLMGFPIDWTSLPPSGTRSSRRSRNGSAGESSTTRPK
jgi:hypothetical protein